jgi:hypothetical protein
MLMVVLWSRIKKEVERFILLSNRDGETLTVTPFSPTPPPSNVPFNHQAIPKIIGAILPNNPAIYTKAALAMRLTNLNLLPITSILNLANVTKPMLSNPSESKMIFQLAKILLMRSDAKRRCGSC